MQTDDDFYLSRPKDERWICAGSRSKRLVEPARSFSAALYQKIVFHHYLCRFTCIEMAARALLFFTTKERERERQTLWILALPFRLFEFSGKSAFCV